MGQAPLENESAQAGAEFRLGQGTGAWSATRNRPRFGCGIAMLAVGLAYGLPLVLFAPAKQVTAGICAPLAVAGAVMMAIPPRRWRDRLYCYEHGIAQYTDPQPEPDMLRWADLTWMTLRIGSGYEGDYISACGRATTPTARWCWRRTASGTRPTS